MTTESKTSDSDLMVQEHCIDLPGESVQCWIGGVTDKLKVVLRKHRDIVFDIHLGNGKTYTLESTESDFYNAREKKLIYASRHDKVTFKDGEKMHVWVSRGFRGALILKCDTHVISEVKPNEWDKQRHSDDPKEKPAPIIITIATPPLHPKPAALSKSSGANDSHADEQSLHVNEVSKAGAPPEILRFFEDGGESLHLDGENIVTRNWTIAQLAGGGGYVFDNRTWINELKGCKFYLKKVIHKSGPKVYMIFSGNNKLREIMSASKYSMQHAKVIRITGGAGGTKQTWDAAKGAAKDSLKVFAKEEEKIVLKGGGIAVVFAIGMDVTEWYRDYSEIGADGKPKKDFYDLFAKVGTDLVKAGLVAALTAVTISALFSTVTAISIAVGAAATAPVALVVIGTIAVGAALVYGVEWIDRKIGHVLGEDDTTSWLAKRFRHIAQDLYKVNKDGRYARYEMSHVVPILR
jgi:hypothetical protein